MEKRTSEIMKLTERLSKDPKSKLFVPLAEEYKKAGDIEMAITVLTEGLKNNPGYVTAKSFLGRLFLDKGDLSEAQKEFEEVIKAIPDNLLAQRKLGDIHALQGRPQEALRFFKAVLTANPKDPELNALVADIEAGRDVRDRISGPRPQPAAATGTTAAAVSSPGAPPSAPSAPAVKPSSAPVVPLPPQQQAAPAIAPPVPDEEEPEEVLVFESLDEAAPVPAAAAQRPESTQDMLDFFAEPVPEKNHEEAARLDDGGAGGEDKHRAGSEAQESSRLFPLGAAGEGGSVSEREPAPMDIPTAFDGAAPAAEEGPGAPDAGLAENAFFDSGLPQVEAEENTSAGDAAHEPAPELAGGNLTEAASADDLGPEALLFDVEPAEDAQSSSFGDAGGPDVVADDEAAFLKEPLPEADDFTTDTLAELYIAQGFYEKAVDIYERMLVDKPHSKLLKDKLTKVRAMGSASGAEEEQGTPVLFEAPPVSSLQPPAADGVRQWTAPGAEAEAKEYIPPVADDFEATAFDAGFAPVEYVRPEKPDAFPSSPADQKAPDKDDEPMPALSNIAGSGKEQTIARLDNWLKNIMKEK